jgi:hypothetical protein
MKNLNLKDIGSSIIGIFVLIQTVYPEATGASILAAFADGSWLGKAIDIAFAFILLRYKGEQVQP